jgi:hypothetical protein
VPSKARTFDFQCSFLLSIANAFFSAFDSRTGFASRAASIEGSALGAEDEASSVEVSSEGVNPDDSDGGEDMNLVLYKAHLNEGWLLRDLDAGMEGLATR